MRRSAGLTGTEHSPGPALPPLDPGPAWPRLGPNSIVVPAWLPWRQDASFPESVPALPPGAVWMSEKLKSFYSCLSVLLATPQC